MSTDDRNQDESNDDALRAPTPIVPDTAGVPLDGTAHVGPSSNTVGSDASKVRPLRSPTKKLELTYDDEVTVGVEMVTRLNELDSLPVLIVGAPASGKSTLVVSLLASTQFDNGDSAFIPDVDIDAYPESLPERESLIEQARNLVIGLAKNFRDKNMLPPRTEVSVPFFIAVKLTMTGTGRIVRLAFLDARGEFYRERKREEVISYTDPATGETRTRTVTISEDTGLPKIVSIVLERLERPLSVICVVPYSDRQKEMREASGAVENWLRNYKVMRHSQHEPKDKSLWLLTKWDDADSNKYGTSFFSPMADEVRAVLQKKYGAAWDAYSARMRDEYPTSHWFMQYSVGVVRADTEYGEKIEHVTDEMRNRVRRYGRTVINWLAHNAHDAITETEPAATSARARGAPAIRYRPGVTIFPDVVSRDPRWWDSIKWVLTGGRR